LQKSSFNEIEHFQKLLELKVMQKMSEQEYQDSEFYKALLQKLNCIDILQTYLRQCVKALKNDEEGESLGPKKELSFALLQIFREQISKREILERMKKNKYKGSIVDDVDYSLIDKIIKRLKFFRTFDPRVR
jgi:hypothetical protein